MTNQIHECGTGLPSADELEGFNQQELTRYSRALDRELRRAKKHRHTKERHLLMFRANTILVDALTEHRNIVERVRAGRPG